MNIDLATWTPLWLSIRLASITTAILLLLGTPLAWWLSHSHSKFKLFIESIVALPIVLPPTVLGFYLLIFFNPHSLVGHFWVKLTGSSLAFSFQGLVVGSVIYSFPFVVQPLQLAFESVGKQPLEAAATLGASAWDRFCTVILPLTRRGFLCAIILGFAHTLGEFGVVLMIGGNIPGKTDVVSIAIFNHVEQLQYHQANILALALLGFSFVILFTLSYFNRHYRRLGIA